jgi:hypothetical protein
MSQKINILCDNLPNFKFEGVTFFSKEIADENFYYLEYLLGDRDLFQRVDIDYFNNNKNENFYFFLPIAHFPFCQISKIFTSDSDFISFLKELFNNPRVKVIFYDFHEKMDVNEIDYFFNYLKENNLNLSNFYLINNDYKISDYSKKRQWQVGGVYKTNHLIYHTCGRLLSYNIPYIDEKEYFFLCKNKMGKPHRVAIVGFLKEYFEKDTNYSLLNPKSYVDNIDYQTFFQPNELFEWIKPAINNILNSSPKNTKWEFDKTNYLNEDQEEFIDFAGILSVKDYEDSYINITTESVFFEDNIHITEKSFKPFGLLQLPLFVASYKHVETLKNYYGFDLFDDIIDHSYDKEENPFKRLLMIFDEIKRLHSNKNEIVNFYKQNKKRLLSNQTILENIFNSNIDKDIIMSIIEK